MSAANLRTTSAIEDPAYRRINGGGKWRVGVTLNSVTRPEVTAAYHGSDFSPVSAERPAQSGETLILAAKGMGATKPVLEPGKVFPGDTFADIVAPVEVSINGQPVEVAVKIGWPTTAEFYRIDVVLPPGLPAGAASLIVSSAWIPGLEAKIPVK